MLLILCAVACGQDWWQDSLYTALAAGDFEASLKNSTLKVIKFFTPWCKYCRFMKADEAEVVGSVKG